jgi:hypothetical protein
MLMYEFIFDAEAMHTFERELTTRRWDAKELSDVAALATYPCHHAFVLGDDVDQGPRHPQRLAQQPHRRLVTLRPGGTTPGGAP